VNQIQIQIKNIYPSVVNDGTFKSYFGATNSLNNVKNLINNYLSVLQFIPMILSNANFVHSDNLIKLGEWIRKGDYIDINDNSLHKQYFVDNLNANKSDAKKYVIKCFYNNLTGNKITETNILKHQFGGRFNI